MTVHITHPPHLAWSPDTHHLFPEVFRIAARTLILCHARLANEPGAYHLGTLPVSVRDEILGKAAPKTPRWEPIRMPRPETPEPEL